nr:zinc finger MYM-type protein 5-like [Hydra vulgaris]
METPTIETALWSCWEKKSDDSEKKNESKNKRTLLDCVRWTKIEDKCKQFNDIEIGINDSNELPDHNSDKLFLADDIDDSQKTSSHLKKDQLDFVLDCHNDQQIYKSDLSIPISNNPALWKSISNTDRTNIILMGPSSNPSNFPRDQKERKFPTYIFLEEQRNGEKVKRDWLVWSKAMASLFCFPCSLFGSPNLTRPGVQSSLLSWNTYMEFGENFQIALKVFNKAIFTVTVISNGKQLRFTRKVKSPLSIS